MGTTEVFFCFLIAMSAIGLMLFIIESLMQFIIYIKRKLVCRKALRSYINNKFNN